AAAEEHLDLSELELPDLVRALSGATVDSGQAMVLDQPWFGLAIPPRFAYCHNGLASTWVRGPPPPWTGGG
ncbi:hypothetical protein, partial [Nocardia cyriacigeorgica]|uniref:hypothetical protein n=1 Tax=Nocardia cyriacigeorgica TaxID=135487 RepID=UPI0024561E95